MPYLKPKEKPFASLSRLIRGYMPTYKELSDILECDYRTAKKKMECPENITVGDLKTLSLKGHIPIDELRGAIK